METSNRTDLRVQKTLDAIRTTFEELLLEMPYAKITVTSLCTRARINKKTFYRYYSTLDDLLAEMESSYVLPYVTRTAGLRYPQDVEQITREFLLYCASQGAAFDAIVCSGSHERILSKVIDGMEAERYASSQPPAGWENEEWKLYMVLVTSSQLRVYKQWVEDGRKVPLERMVEIACLIICRGAEIRSK